MTTNEIAYARLKEDERANKAREQETYRNNVVVATETNRSNLARESETHRSNVVNENENLRHNLAIETETNRSNLAREQETYRSNFARETETRRANIATEAWRNASLAETSRSNRAQEALAAQRNAIASQSNEIQKQHNLATQELTRVQNSVNANNALLRYTVDTRNATTAEKRQASDARLNQSREALNKEQGLTETYKRINLDAQSKSSMSSANLSDVSASRIDALLNSELFSNYAGSVAGLIRSGSALVH